WHSAKGDIEAATREIDRAHEIDELSRLMNVTKGFVYYFARRYQESLEQFRETIIQTTEYRVAAFDAAYYGVALVEAFSNSFTEPLKAAKTAYKFSLNVLNKVSKAFIFARAHRNREARAELKKLISDSKKTYVSPYHLATIAAA